MCRLILLLLLMANIVPLFVEGGKCYDGPGPADGYDERECGPSSSTTTGACYFVKCTDGNGNPYGDPRGCGTCTERFGTDEPDGCKCIDCTGDLCNNNKKPVNKDTLKCYKGPTGPGEEYENCTSFNNEGCYSMDCSHATGPFRGFRKGCGTCGSGSLEVEERPGCKCTNCRDKNFCNDKSIGSIKQCYGGLPDSSANYGKVDCKFHNNNACQTMECTNLRSELPSQIKRCGKCPDERSLKDEDRGSSCTCTDCTGELCNSGKAKSKGNININQCYLHRPSDNDKGYKTENCTFYNNDACFTIDCLHDDIKGCGKCPSIEKFGPFVAEYVKAGCKCTECTDGDLCNKPAVVNKCYWGDDQKGYEPMECKADGINNKACKVVKCRGGQISQIVDGRSRAVDNPLNVSKVYRDCGKCSREMEMQEPCQCFTCNDNDLCNGAIRIGPSSFPLMILAMIVGAVLLLAMKPLVASGI